MQRGMVPVLRQASLAAVAAALLLGLVFVGVAGANPVPVAAVLVHVHPWDSLFCINNPISDCWEVNQYSEIEGDVEFDLYLANPYDMMAPFSDVHFTVEWPEAWQYTSFESCSGGSVTEYPGPRSVGLYIQYGSPVAPGDFLLLGRFRMQVNGFGRLQFTEVAFDGEYYGEVGPAQAGVECEYSFLDCYDLMPPCGGHFDEDLLEIEVPQGGTASGTINVWNGWNGELPCPVVFEDTEDWMTAAVEWDPGYYTGVLHVSVDAEGLDPGVYEGRVKAVTEVVNCATVRMTVQPVSAAPEPGPPEPPVSWGRVKSAYR